MDILSVFFSPKCDLFHNSNIFSSCIIHILYTGCAKIKKNNSDANSLMSFRIIITGYCENHTEHMQMPKLGGLQNFKCYSL